MEDTAMTLPMTTSQGRSRAPFDEKLNASIRKVLRGRGVPDREIDDKCQTVFLIVAKSSRVPAEEPRRTKYIHGIARNVARRYHEGRGEPRDAAPFDEDVAPPADEVAPYESFDLAHRLHAAAVAHDPQGAEWLVRAKVYGENETVIASGAGVPVDRVRQRIRRLMIRMRANSEAITVLASLLLVATFIGYWSLRKKPVVDVRPDEAMSATPPHEPAPQESPSREEPALELRQAALAACVRSEWVDCIMKLDRAKEMDPAGDTAPEVQAARSAARRELIRMRNRPEK
jgi:DNA-directed RNA polymerase specialized sigma24 family protein